MDHKSSVLKSKSSNSAMTKSDKSNKKTRSNGEFQPVTLKKRGVYVEKKNTKSNLISLDDKGSVKQVLQRPIRPPPRPPRGQKKFLASVLTILSKNSTATQYPDGPADPESLESPESPESLLVTEEKDKPVRAKRMKRLDVETSEKGTQDTLVKKKTKYRSRVLNKMLHKDSKKVLILQNRKEITHSPSNYSNKSYKEFRDARNKSLPPPINYDDYKNCDELNTMKNIIAKSKKAVAQAQAKLKDPITLVNEPQKDDTGLYNFFVDLIEATFSVYNVDTDFKPPSNELDSTSVFQIDENVAKKLTITKNNNDDITRNEEETLKAKPTRGVNKRYSVIDHQLDRPISPISLKPRLIRSQYKRKLKYKSFNYQNPKFKVISPLQSVIMNKPSSKKKKQKKQTFLNMLKEQLRKDDCSYEKPQNMHQALMIIARNKRRNEHAKHFANNADRKHECGFKSRQVFSSINKPIKKNYNLDNNNERFFDKTFRTDTISHGFSDTKSFFSKNLPKSANSMEFDKIESSHSLEVHSYHFEPIPKRLFEDNKQIIFAKKRVGTITSFNEEFY